MEGEVLVGSYIPGANDAAETVDHSAIVGDSNLWDDLIVDRAEEPSETTTPSTSTDATSSETTATTTESESESEEASLIDDDEAKPRT